MAQDNLRFSIAAAWFLRACSFILVILWVLTSMRHGWPRDIRGLAGLVYALMLFLLSFALLTSGRTKLVFAIGSIVLALLFTALAAAGLLFP